MTDRTCTTKVVVLGGGYAGTLAANHLRTRADIDVVLINPRAQFVERIRLHQFAAGTGTATVDYGTLLGAGINRLVDTAVRIEAPNRRVALASGAELDYDYLIYAVGSNGAGRASVPGAVEFALPVAELEYAERLRTALEEEAAVTVVGGGITGIETAAELADQGRDVTLVAGGTLAPSFSEPGRASVARWLARHQVDVREAASVIEVRRDAVVLDDGAVVPSAVTVWTAGFGVPDLATRSGLATDPSGRLLTDETLTSVADERVVAAGDAAAPSGRPLRMSCQAAIPLGAQAANTILSRIAGTPPRPLDQAFAGTCASLGRHAATFQLAQRDDTSVNFYVGGRLGASIKELACRATLWSLRQEARRPGSAVWLKGGRRATSAEQERATSP